MATPLLVCGQRPRPSAATPRRRAGRRLGRRHAAGSASRRRPLPGLRCRSSRSPRSATQLSPSFLMTCASTPAAGAGTSSTTLSVSISIRISSRATASPAFFFHCSRVASATDSDSCGTLTSIDGHSACSFCVRVRVARLLGQHEALELAEGLLEQRLLLLLVQVRVAHRRRRRRRHGRRSRASGRRPCSRGCSAARRTRRPGSAARPGTRRPRSAFGYFFSSAANALCGNG